MSALAADVEAAGAAPDAPPPAPAVPPADVDDARRVARATAALAASREARLRVARERALPPDMAVLAAPCPGCERVATATLVFTTHAYGDAAGRPWYRSLRELQAWFAALLAAPPPSLAHPDDAAASGPDADRCRCGEPRASRPVAAARFYHAMAGAGADLVLEARRVPDEPAASGAKGRWAGRVLRSPPRGAERPLPDGADDRAVVARFDRGVTLADAWLPLLAAAAAARDTPPITRGGEVEPGLWLYAAPAGADVDAWIRAARGARDACVVPLEALARAGALAPEERAWPLWAREHAGAIARGEVRAGALVDLPRMRDELRLAIASLGLAAEEPAPGVVVARRGEACWPLELGAVAARAVLLGLTLAEGAALAADEAGARLDAVERFVREARALRPDAALRVEGTSLVATRAAGAAPARALSLLTAPFALAGGRDALARELRFACDDVPAWSDPTRVCPCGAPAFVVARLVPWALVEHLARAAGGAPPVVVARWPDAAPRAAQVVTLACDRHARAPYARELGALGLTGDDVARRLRQDLGALPYRFRAAEARDDAGRLALVAVGPHVATAITDEHLAAALHDAAGAPLRAVVAATPARAVAGSPDVLALCEPGFDDARLERALAAALRARHGAGFAAPFVLARELRLDGLRAGRFERDDDAPPPPPHPAPRGPSPE